MPFSCRARLPDCHARRDPARRHGDAGGGAVAIIQRFGAALNLNVHIHALVVDGVFTLDEGRPRFWPARPAQGEEFATLTATIARRIRAVLARRGLSDDGAGVEAVDLWAEMRRSSPTWRPLPCAA